jgi:hypothetical protein
MENLLSQQQRHFVLADGKDNKLAKDKLPEEIGQLPWRTLVSQEELRKRLSS